MFENVLTGLEGRFLLGLLLTFIFAYMLGTEREVKGKSAGIGTSGFVIGGSFIFTLASIYMDPNSPSRIAAYIVAGVGFLGAGLILKSDTGVIKNLTTAAEVWFSAAIGMCIGLEWYVMAVLATLFSILILHVPHIADRSKV